MLLVVSIIDEGSEFKLDAKITVGTLLYSIGTFLYSKDPLWLELFNFSGSGAIC